MKVSTRWLQAFFDAPLPNAEALADGLTFHAFEIESVATHGDDRVLDVKVTPNRGHDCLSHRGIAKELSAICDVPIAHDPFTEHAFPHTDAIAVALDPVLGKRYMAGYVRGITVGPSPQWLKERLEAIGQRSINNVVDITNFVMFTTGQPMHAFDAHKLRLQEEKYALGVRRAYAGEEISALDGKTYALTAQMPVIIDAHTDTAIGIAGVKGGSAAAIDDHTTDIILESAQFNPVLVRKTAQALKLRTDASQRFEQELSPELCGFAMQYAIEHLLRLAGGVLEGVVDAYPEPQPPARVSLSVPELQQYVPTFGPQDIRTAFTKLGFSFTEAGDVFTVLVPKERLDLTLPADLIEEVVRIIGYDHVPSDPLPSFPHAPEIHPRFYWNEMIRSFLLEHGCSEVYNSVFSNEGDVVVLNKVDGKKPYLRRSLAQGLMEALEKNVRNKELLALPQVRLFEIGTVWQGETEQIHMGIAVEPMKKASTAEEILSALAAYLGVSLSHTTKGTVVEVDLTPVYAHLTAPAAYPPASKLSVRYAPFSKYPFIVRDIALWVPESTAADTIEALLREHAGTLCVSVRLFDAFTKEGRTSYAFRLIFQSFDRTLLDTEANEIMESLATLLHNQGFEIR